MSCRLKRCQTTVARRRVFPSPGSCAGPGLPRRSAHLNTGHCSTRPPARTLDSTLEQQLPLPNSPSSKNSTTKSKLWTRSCRSCIHWETRLSTITQVRILILRTFCNISSCKLLMSIVWLPAGRGLSAQFSLSIGGSSDGAAALCTNGASASTSFHPSLAQHQDSANSTDKLRYAQKYSQLRAVFLECCVLAALCCRLPGV